MSREAPAWARGHHGGRMRYHARLLGDPFRMDAYERAIRQLVRPGDVVLDLGAGTGVLGMWAARRGARRVYAVESTAAASLAEELVRANRLEHIVQVIRADATELAPVEPVDLVVSEFMGRFVLDDGMLWAVEAADRWLKPDGRCCPAEVVMRVAPVTLDYHMALDQWDAPIGGLAFDAVRRYALNDEHQIDLQPEQLLAEPAVFRRLRPPRDMLSGLDATLRFTMARAGRLCGLVGWFDATLADGVVLTTAPGYATHWGQYFLPLPPRHVEAGDTLEARLWFDAAASTQDYIWRWAGQLHRGATQLAAFELENEPRLGERPPAPSAEPPAPPPQGREAIMARNGEGKAHFEAGDYAAAKRAFADACCGLGPEEDDLAPLLWENLGLANAVEGCAFEAIPAFLRALDGVPTSREQSARLLVNCYLALGWRADGYRALDAYEAAFGPHPRGWRRPAAAPEDDEEPPGG